MIKLHFKRQGSGSTLILQGLPVGYFARSAEGFHSIWVERSLDFPKVSDGKEYTETYHQNVLSKKYDKESKDERLQEIQKDLSELLQLDVEVESYIESYYIGSNPKDKDILNGIDITGFSTKDVIDKCGIDLAEFFSPWNATKEEPIKSMLVKPSQKLLEVRFSKLYTLIHWCNVKADHRAELLKLA